VVKKREKAPEGGGEKQVKKSQDEGKPKGGRKLLYSPGKRQARARKKREEKREKRRYRKRVFQNAVLSGRRKDRQEKENQTH